MDLIEKYLGEAREMIFKKSILKDILKQGKGFVVFGSEGGVSDERIIGFTKDQINKAKEKGKEDIIIKNVDREIKNAKADAKMNKWKGRKIMIRED